MSIVNILILNWNSSQSVKKCLTAIKNSTDQNLRVILIDNCSIRKDILNLYFIYKEYKSYFEIFFLKNKKNLGYAGGNNSGINYLNKLNLTGDVLILNPDVQISGNTIAEMKNFLQGNTGIITVRAINQKGKILFDAMKLRGFSVKEIITSRDKIPTDFSQGSCMLINRDLINKIGFFDERFFLYWEEVDFSIRARNHGFKLFSITTTHILKNDNNLSSFPNAYYYSIRNAKLIKDKYKNHFSNFSYIIYLIKMFLLIFKFSLKPKIFAAVMLNFFYAIHDSSLGLYYMRANKDSK
jgi:GT2 family glycosyltransferase